MARLEDIVNHPDYAAAATASSKTSLFVFIATFGYLIFFSETSPGIVWGALFFFVGTFAVPLLVTIPLFFLFARSRRFARLFSVANVAVVILVTRAAFLGLFGAPSVTANLSKTPAPFSVSCREPIPEFTLGFNSNPSDTPSLPI